MQAKLILPARARLGEGPLWIPEQHRLYWLDIDGLKLHRFDPLTGTDESISLSTKVGCIVPCDNGHFLLASQSGIEEVRIEGDRLETIGIVAHPEAEKTGTRYNDGKCSPEGRFWFGSLSLQRRPEASLYVLDERSCRRVIEGATNSNGLGWSPDGRTFYWIDTPTLQIEAFDYDPVRGELSKRRTAVVFPEGAGRPDGMTVDAEGMIWVAHWLGARVSRWNPTKGEQLDEIRLSVSRVTSATFGGAKLDTLFITTASDPEEVEPDAGGLFAVNFNGETTGLPPACFRRFS